MFARTAIDLRTRELAACAAFAAVGNQVMVTPLRVHVQAALNTGATREEVRAILVTGRPIAEALRPDVVALHYPDLA